VHYEPLGVILIFGSWNYPLFTTLKPLIQSITTGNCALIKPSEISCNSSKVMKKLVETYLDQDCYRVMEGEMELAISLSAQKFDGIVFTGST
jgi:aldehyde dehydrogenase (NAD+)